MKDNNIYDTLFNSTDVRKRNNENYDSILPQNSPTFPLIPLPDEKSQKEKRKAPSPNAHDDKYDSIHNMEQVLGVDDQNSNSMATGSRSLYTSANGTRRKTGYERLNEVTRTKYHKMKKKAKKKVKNKRFLSRKDELSTSLPDNSRTLSQSTESLSFRQNMKIILVAENNEVELCPRITFILILLVIIIVTTLIVLSTSDHWPRDETEIPAAKGNFFIEIDLVSFVDTE